MTPEVKAAIQQLREQLDALEQLLTPVPIVETKEEIPAVAKKEDKVDEDTLLGCQIISALPDFYTGKCTLLKIHKRYFDNGLPKYFIDKYHVVVEAYDDNMNKLGEIVTHWSNLSKFHIALINKGINKHLGAKWLPLTLVLEIN